MDVKTVGLDRDAYDRLRAEKREGESFSDVVKRITRKRRPLADFAGRWKHVPAEEIRNFDAVLKDVRATGLEQADRPLRRAEGRHAGR